MRVPGVLGRYGDFTRTLATTLTRTCARTSSTATCTSSAPRSSALFEYNIPVSSTRASSRTCTRTCRRCHRYLRLRQKIMGLPSLATRPLRPMVDKVELTYTPEQQGPHAGAFAPLGPEYVAALRKGYDSRWVTSCRTPASARAPTAPWSTRHPYQLLNFNAPGRRLDTRARVGPFDALVPVERGAAVLDADYSIFVAEWPRR